MRRPDPRPLCLLLAIMLSLTVFALPSFAAYESDESGGTDPPEYIGSVITITSEEMGDMPEAPETDGVILPEPDLDSDMDMDAFFESLFALLLGGDLSGLTPDDALTPEGNLTLVDDILQGGDGEGKQFLTVQSKNGNYFYLVIDRSGDKDNVHFLNLVDEADLLALMEDGDAEKDETPAVCTCKDRCYAGHVDTTCAICAVNMTECTGKEPEPTPTPTPTVEPEPEPPAKKNTSGAAVLLLVVVLGGGAVYYYLIKVKGVSLPFGKPKASGSSFSETESDEGDDDFLEFEKSDEAEEPEDAHAPYIPDNGEYWPEDEKGGTAK